MKINGFHIKISRPAYPGPEAKMNFEKVRPHE